MGSIKFFEGMFVHKKGDFRVLFPGEFEDKEGVFDVLFADLQNLFDAFGLSGGVSLCLLDDLLRALVKGLACSLEGLHFLS